MLVAFNDNSVAAVKGAYRTRQRQLIARFVQLEYEDRYRHMERFDNIDFVDTYSAAFRRDTFLELGGFDSSFPVACAEDADLSYRMSAQGLKMKFVPRAIVGHSHPHTLSQYCKKKYKFAFWRMVALRKNPQKAIRDSHTPQLMKFQLLFLPGLLLAMGIDLAKPSMVHASLFVLAIFFCSTLPFALRAFVKDPLVGLVSPVLLALRSFAQFFGVTDGMLYAHRHSQEVASKCAA
jgi:GT2 family glycosyltransferase